DQLALAAADGDHGVDRLDAGLERLLDRLALGNAGGDDVHLAALAALDGRAAVERLAQRVDHAPDHRAADGRLEQPAGGLNRVALLDLQVVAEDDGADRLLLQVEHLAHRAVLELQQLAGHRVAQAVDPGDAVADL